MLAGNLNVRHVKLLNTGGGGDDETLDQSCTFLQKVQEIKQIWEAGFGTFVFDNNPETLNFFCNRIV